MLLWMRFRRLPPIIYIMCEGKFLNSLEVLNKMLGRDLILSL